MSTTPRPDLTRGEVRPEYYYNCTNITDAAKPVEYIKFENGKEIYQDINYVVAANQTLTVNTQASAVFDASIGRDVDAMIEAVKFAQDANNKVEELEKMQKMQEYSSDDCQAALEDWIARRRKNAIMRTIICRSFTTAISGILTIICRRSIWRTRTSEARDRAWI